MISIGQLIAALVGCVLAQAFFVSSEVALSACDRNRLRQRAAGGNARAARAERMLAVPQVTLATTLVGANLMTLLAVLVLGTQLAMRGASPLWAPLITVPPLLVLGHLVPKAIVQAHADRVVDRIATQLRLASFVLRPFVAVVGGFAALLTRVTRTDRKKAFVTRDELALLTDETIDEIIDQKASFKLMGALASLRRELGIEKVDSCVDIIEELLESGRKLVVFAWHQDVIAKLNEAFAKYNPIAINGRVTNKNKRHEMTKAFQTKDEHRIFIGNIQSTGVGLTLTASHTVLFVESSWVPGENDQAIDRVDRYTQTQTVDVLYLVYPHDLDERIIKSCEKKRKVTNKLIKGEP